MDSGAQRARTPDRHRLDTENLSLVPVTVGDFDRYFGLLGDAEVMKYIGVEQGKLPTRSEVIDLVNYAVEAWEIRGWGRWSIFEKASGEFVGFTGYRCENGTPEWITVVHERFWGNGYAAEAGKVCLKHGFEVLNFQEISAVSRPANTRARALLDRMGFEFKGIIDFHGVEGASYLLTAT